MICNKLDYQDVINCIGGLQVLMPLLEEVNRCPTVPDNSLDDLIDPTEVLSSGEEQTDDWVVVPSSSYAGTYQNQSFQLF